MSPPPDDPDIQPGPTGQPPEIAFASGAEWLRGEGEHADVVMSSRARLARNLAGFPFMTRADRAARQAILDLCRAHINACALANRLLWLDLHKAGAPERTLLVERHLISQQHARGRQSTGAGGLDEPRAVAVSIPDERLAVMVNEEDHLRVQVLRSGLALDRAWEECDAADDKLEAGLDYAFAPRFGYLTACPTNVGTGVRFSVMLHLPALKLTGEIDKVKRAAADLSLAVRGFYGEGSDAAGDFYQISNQVTLGKSERIILHELHSEIIPKVVEYERAARRTLLAKRRASLEDQVFRALGLLRHARLMTAEESMQLLSHVRLGVVLGLISGISQTRVNQLMLLTQPAHLQRAAGRPLDQEQRRAVRAQILQQHLAS